MRRDIVEGKWSKYRKGGMKIAADQRIDIAGIVTHILLCNQQYRGTDINFAGVQKSAFCDRNYERYVDTISVK